MISQDMREFLTEEQIKQIGERLTERILNDIDKMDIDINGFVATVLRDLYSWDDIVDYERISDLLTEKICNGLKEVQLETKGVSKKE